MNGLAVAAIAWLPLSVLAAFGIGGFLVVWRFGVAGAPPVAEAACWGVAIRARPVVVKGADGHDRSSRSRSSKQS